MHTIDIKKIDFNAHKDKMVDILDMLMCNSEKTDEHLYKHIKCELYELIHGKKISEEVADEWVHSMRPMGMRWTKKETDEVLHKMNYSLDPVDFYVVMNMVYNDFYDVLEEHSELAIKLAKDWLHDVDTKPYKLYEYWKHLIDK